MSKLLNWIRQNYGPIIFKIVIIVMLVWATKPNPYDYYVILRWTVCASAIYFLIKAEDEKFKLGMIIFGVIAIIYNPVIPLHLSRGLWEKIDVATAMLFFLSFLPLRNFKI